MRSQALLEQKHVNKKAKAASQFGFSIG